MKISIRKIKSNLNYVSLFILLCLSQQVICQSIPYSSRSKKAIEAQKDLLIEQFNDRDLTLGSEVFLRIFKETHELEVWIKQDSIFKLFTTYNICTYSGNLGTKKKEGDGKSPEGFYTIKPPQLHPTSAFHLAFNIGYPNQLERSLGYTGYAIMIHGNCVSDGCYAMTDEIIEKLWTIVTAAFENGQKEIPLHIFPFHLTDQNIESHQSNPSISLWENMQKEYHFFEQNKQLPCVIVKGNHYDISN